MAAELQAVDDKYLLIAGNSHTGSFGMSAAPSHQLVDIPGSEQKAVGLVGPWPRNFDEYWDSVQEHAAGRVVAMVFGGNIHLSEFLFAPSPMFDVVPSLAPELPIDETVVLIPEEAIRALFLQSIGTAIQDRIRRLTTVAKGVIVCGSPPPKGDDEFIRSRFSTEPYFSQQAEKLGLTIDEMPLSPPILRLKLWLVLQTVLRDVALKNGAVFVPVPSETQTPEGFLRPEMYLQDATHANQKFGQAMLPYLLRAAAPGSDDRQGRHV